MSIGLPLRPLPKTIEWMPPEQAAAIRAMPLGRQIELSFELRELARQSIEANVKSEHSAFTPQQVHAQVDGRMKRRDSNGSVREVPFSMAEQTRSRPLPKTIDRPSKREAAVFRNLPVTRPVEMVFEMWELAWGLVESSVRADHPDWSPERVRSEVKERMRYDAA